MAIYYFPKDNHHRFIKMGYLDYGGYLISGDTKLYDCTDESVWDKNIVAICIVRYKQEYYSSLFKTQ